MKKLLAILITVLSLVALVTPTYARVTIPAGSGYSKEVGETTVDNAVVIPEGTELYTDGSINIRELPDVSSNIVHSIDAPYGNCRAFSFYVTNDRFYWGKGSDGLDHQWTEVCLTADMSSFYGYVRTDLLIVDYDVELAYVDNTVSMNNVYCETDEGTISFRDLNEDLTLNEFLHKTDDEFINCDTNSVNSFIVNMSPKFGIAIIGGGYNQFKTVRCKENYTEFYGTYDSIGTIVTCYDPITVAGHDVACTHLAFLGTDKDNEHFTCGTYTFPDENCVETYSDLLTKLTSLYGEPTIVNTHTDGVSLDSVYWLKENGYIGLWGFTYGNVSVHYSYYKNIDNICEDIINNCNNNELSTNVDGL